VRYEVTVEVDGAPERVWRALEDVETWPTWTPTMTSVRLLDGGPIGVGSAAEVLQPKLPRNVWRVTAFEPGRRFEWAAAGPGVTTRADHRIEPLGDERSRVTLELEMTGPLAGAVSLFLGGLSRRYVAREAAGLKQHCENEAGRAAG
jgi:uncharacterized membrane protein